MKKIFTILLLISAMISNAQSVSITSSASGAVCAGTAVTFTATPVGVTNPTYQWYKNSIAITGATSSTYSTTTLNNNDQIYVTCADIPSIVNDNSLQLWLDAGNSASYSSGTTWSDLSGKNNHGTLMNGASFDATSKSIVTNGVDQYVSVPLFNNSISNTTMQTWVYINANSHGGFMANGTSSYSIGIGSNVSGEMNSNGNQAWMLFSSVRYINTNTTYSTGWHLVTMTMSASSVPSFYLDGSFVFTSSGSNPNTPSGSFNLGAVPGDGPKYYNGKFAAAYFYNRVLSSTEISQNYNASAARFGGSGSSSISSNSITSTVNPISSITIVGGAQNSQTVCNNTAISRISYNTTGATGANFSSLPANITGSWSNNVVSINGTPTVSGNYSYTVNLTGGCGTISATGSITVNASPTATLTVSGDACINKTTLSATSGVYSYTWAKDNVTISGATGNTYSPTLAGDYKVAISNGTCSNTSTTTTIYTCGVTADGKMGAFGTSIVLVNKEGAINSGGGIDERGLILNIPGTVVIGTQRWKDVNLDISTYRNGDNITYAADATAWNNATNAGTGVWCYYNFDAANNAVYGKLYNWYAVNDSRGLAPLGYHVPTETEWDTFLSYLGGYSVAGGKIKTTGTSLWASPNTGATNSSGFNGLPGGYTYSGSFYSTATAVGFWWSASQYNSTDAWTYNVSKDDSNIRKSNNSKNFGFSVRLIKD